MSNEINFKEKLLQLKEWLPSIIEAVKKDLKNEHLKQDFAFIKKYLPGKNVAKVTADELAEAYEKALTELENGPQIAEFIAHRWIFRNSELYHYFEEKLSQIAADFTQIKELTDEQAEPLLKEASAEFGALKTYIFCLINAVAVKKERLQKLEKLAREEKVRLEEEAVTFAKASSLDEMKQRFEREMARMSDKYEKKLLGLEKKYHQDVGVLKKQLANIQRKLAGV